MIVEIPRTVLKTFSKPLTGLYSGVIFLRNLIFDHKLISARGFENLTIICVGNVAAGGSGKTPLVIYLKNLLTGLYPDKQILVLSRGYGGSLEFADVSQHHTADQVGDEVVMLKKLYGCSVIVAKKRVTGAQYISEHFPGAIVIMDDGFQHRRLLRNLNILAFNVVNQAAVDQIIAAKLLPTGRLREPLDVAAGRADFYCLNHRSFSVESETSELAARLEATAERPTGRTVLKSCGIFPVSGDSGREIEPDAEIVLLAALANPDGFVQAVDSLGFKVQQRYLFVDHHKFSVSELEKVTARGLPVVCTAKDAVKIAELGVGVEQFYYLSVGLEFLEGEAALIGLVQGVVGEKTG